MVRWNGRLSHFVLGFKKIQITLYTYVLAKIVQNGEDFIQKLTPGFKNHMRNFDNFRQAVESPKTLKFDGLLLSIKYIPSAEKLYAEDLSNITFNYLHENSPNSLCYFWNHKSFFTTQLFCIFLTQTLYTFYKNSLSKCRFSDFPLLPLKFTKIPHVIFQTTFGSLLITKFVFHDKYFFCTFFSWKFTSYLQK